MSKKRNLPLLLADDISIETGREKRSATVKFCAGKIAEKLKCSIDLVHAENLLLYPVYRGYRKSIIDKYFAKQKRNLSEIAKSIRVSTRAMFVSGEPAETILALSRKKNAYEMIVLGTHGRKGISRLLLGSVAEEVIRNATIPVLTVGPMAQKSANKFMRGSKPTILIPTALTPNSKRAEAYGIDLAKRLGGKVILFHGLAELQAEFIVPHISSQLNQALEELKEEAWKQLSRMAAKLRKSGVPVSIVVDRKTPSSSDGILKQMQESSADLIVMGTHGRSMISGAFFGRTVRNVILESPIPVITVFSRRQ